MAGTLTPLIPGLGSLLYVSYKSTLHEVEEIFDAELAHAAKLIATLVRSNPGSKQQSITGLQKSVRARPGLKTQQWQKWGQIKFPAWPLFLA